MKTFSSSRKHGFKINTKQGETTMTLMMTPLPYGRPNRQILKNSKPQMFLGQPTYGKNSKPQKYGPSSSKIAGDLNLDIFEIVAAKRQGPTFRCEDFNNVRPPTPRISKKHDILRIFFPYGRDRKSVV